MLSRGNFVLFMGRRISLRRAGHGTPGVAIAVIGIAIAMAVMIVATSVASGFKHEIRRKLAGFHSSIVVYTDPSYNSGNDLYAAEPTIMSLIAETSHSTPRLRLDRQAVLRSDSDFCGVDLRGLQAESESFAFFGQAITDGTMPDSSGHIAISTTTARQLGVESGSRLTAHFISRDSHITTRRLTVSGIFDTGFGDFDGLIAIAPLLFMQQLSGGDSLTVSSITIDGIPEDWLDLTAEDINDALYRLRLNAPDAPVLNAFSLTQTGAAYLNWLELIDANVALVLALMGIVAGFTLISCLFIVLLDNVQLIGLLRTIGATNARIGAIFSIAGLRIIVRGIIWGDITGGIIVAAQALFQFIPLDPQAYYLSSVPVRPEATTLLLLNAGVLVGAMLLTVIPAMCVGRFAPARTASYD